jgi:peptide/nickel transport system substrate-binding protein
VQQSPYLQAAIGNPKYFRECKSFFPCGTPMASGAGSEAMVGDLGRAKQLLAESGYNGGKVVLLIATDIPINNAMGLVTADLLKKLDMNLEVAATDWGTLFQRRASQEPEEKGGWSLFHTSASTAEYFSPAAHLGLRSDGRAAWAGWPTDPKMEELRKAWIFASSADAQAKIGAEIEQEAFRFVPYVPLGQYNTPTAYRKTITDVMKSSAPVFWNLHKA